MAGWPAVLTVLGLTALGGGGALARPQDAPGGMVQRIDSPCSSQDDCQLVDHGRCNMTTGSCQCRKTHPIPNEVSCLKAVAVNGTCTITAQCRPGVNYAECVHGMCQCSANYYMHTYGDGIAYCLPNDGNGKAPVDPAVIGILAAMVLMFVIICVVLRLFSKAQFRQNRTILNSANSRLMNASFLKGSLIKSPVEQLRGSHSSRGSRAPSLSSLSRPDAATAGADNERRHTSSTAAAGDADVNLVQVEMNQQQQR